jgi:hypothetical protein
MKLEDVRRASWLVDLEGINRSLGRLRKKLEENKNLAPVDVEAIENSIAKLEEKKNRLEEKVNITSTSGNTPDEIEYNGEKGKVLGVYYKIQVYKKDGTLSKAVRYVPKEEV